MYIGALNNQSGVALSLGIKTPISLVNGTLLTCPSTGYYYDMVFMRCSSKKLN